MTHALPPLTKDLIDAFAASAVAWLVRLLGVLFAPGAQRRKRLLHRFVLRIEREVECILFLRAFHAFGPPPRSRNARRPRSAPPGFRRTAANRRLLFKSAHIRAARGATLIARVTRLLEALAHGELYVARFLRRFSKGVCFSRLIACAPPAVAFTSAEAPAVAFADSS